MVVLGFQSLLRRGRVVNVFASVFALSGQQLVPKHYGYI